MSNEWKQTYEPKLVQITRGIEVVIAPNGHMYFQRWESGLELNLNILDDLIAGFTKVREIYLSCPEPPRVKA